ncbi:hypothetical protein [Chryseobacterium sp.]|uniref:hypothetical protein n=1 Tax=Chryseobacterium sp. TaxID=1871047 RepID=UPI0031DD07E1
MALRRYATHKKAKKIINDIYDNNNHCLIIHYSCESFYEIVDGKTPRITSIAVRFLHTAQTKSFSIHKVAELKRVPFNEISERYDELEKEMLKEFFEFVKLHKDYKWIHWNMRDINFGFEAINYRASILGARPIEINDENKFDLARILIDKYGKNYASHPRLPSILEVNGISSLHWLNGENEATCFNNKDFVKLHQSTLAKVDVFENILKLSAEENLRTKSTWKDIYGFSIQGIYEMIKENWLFSVILFIIATITAFYIQKLFN